MATVGNVLLLSCPPLKGSAEDFDTVEAYLIVVPVKGPFVHDGALHRKSGHRLKCGGGVCAYTYGFKLSSLFPFLQQLSRDT